MIDKLDKLIPEFSKVNHTHCFLHVINLVGQTLVKQFDVHKTVTSAVSINKDDDICELAGDLDYNHEEQQMQEALLWESVATDSNVEPNDNVEGWVNEMAVLSVAD